MKLKWWQQRNVPWLGALIDSLYTMLPMLGAINFISVTIVLYETLRPHLLVIFPWMKVYYFLGFFCLLALGMMAFVYVLVLPSIWTFRNRQMHAHDSEQMRLLRDIEKLLKDEKSSID